jgi:hypothetical protein
MMNRFVLTSVEQFFALLKNHSQLGQMPEFQSFVSQSQSQHNQVMSHKNCNCGSANTATQMNLDMRPRLESVMGNLTTDQIAKIKSVAGLSDFCYYIRNSATGKLELKCY